MPAQVFKKHFGAVFTVNDTLGGLQGVFEGEQGRVEHVFWLFKGLPEGLVSVSPTASAEGSSHVYETPGSGRLRTEGACKARGCNPSDRHQREQESTDAQEQGEASLTWK